MIEWQPNVQTLSSAMRYDAAELAESKRKFRREFEYSTLQITVFDHLEEDEQQKRLVRGQTL